MYKKIGVILLALILMFNFTFKDYADAAIASKVASQAAKQMAQEVIQDIAAETITNFALNQAIDIVDKYEAREGYKIVCPDGGSDCSKPIQVKENITDSDKKAIKGQAGTELDKLLNGGSGVPKWQKFLDWFMPIWLISFGATAITYAFDSDVRSLFNEAGYNALVALGFIVPISEPIDMAEHKMPVGYESLTPKDEDGNTVPSFFAGIGLTNSTSNRTTYMALPNFQAQKFENAVIKQNFTNTMGTINSVDIKLNISTDIFFINEGWLRVGLVGMYNSPPSYSMEFDNGEFRSGVFSLLSGKYVISLADNPLPIDYKKVSSVQITAPYKVGNKNYVDYMLRTREGQTMKLQVVASSIVMPEVGGLNSEFTYTAVGSGARSTLFYTPDITPYRNVLVPPYVEIEELEPMASSSYENDSGNVALIPPAALTYKEEATGETVYRVPAAVPTSPPVFQKEDGTPVPEEEITVAPAPNVTPAPNGTTTEKGEPIPEGTPTVTPAPTPSNPAPAPIPLTPTPTPTTPTPEPTTPVEPPTNGEPPTTGEPIPDEPGCEEKFKFPILSPLKETFSTAFPFSIPWDIERAINAAFSGIGHEKPKFNLDLNVLGQKETIEITTPKMFDDWKPFTDTLLVLTFDVLIMFGVYRFVKGAGS